MATFMPTHRSITDLFREGGGGAALEPASVAAVDIDGLFSDDSDDLPPVHGGAAHTRIRSDTPPSPTAAKLDALFASDDGDVSLLPPPAATLSGFPRVTSITDLFRL